MKLMLQIMHGVPFGLIVAYGIIGVTGVREMYVTQSLHIYSLTVLCQFILLFVFEYASICVISI